LNSISNLQQLAAPIQQRLDSMDAWNLSAAITRLPKMGCGDSQLYAACMLRYLQFAPTDNPRNLSNVIYALCKAPEDFMQQHQAALQQQLVPTFMAKASAASAQDISNVVYGMAVSKQRLPKEIVQQLVTVFAGELQQAAPQAVANTLWGVATMDQKVPIWQLQQMLAAFVSMLQQAKPQNVSNVLWAVASMDQQVPDWQLQQLLGAFISMLQQAKPQEVSNTLWAVATMDQDLPAGQLQRLVAASVSMLQQAKPQEVSNLLWACAKLGFLPQQLLAAPGLTGLLLADTRQGLANAAWACGQVGHRGEQLMVALLAEVERRLAAADRKGSNSSKFSSQGLCNLCWAVAVLDLQQHAQQVLQLAQACSSMWTSAEQDGQRQLWQVHTWLLDFQLAGGQGLQGSLTEQQLQQCRAAWQEQMQLRAKQQHTDFQRSVFAAVQQLPNTWQQQPQMEQLSMGRDGVTPDGALLLDIAGRTAAGVLVAVEADGPTHFRRPDGGLMGATQDRNRALAVLQPGQCALVWLEQAEAC
jgi:hypothetical protein